MNNYKNFKDTALTADWLRDKGLNDKTFSTAKLNAVRAQTMAHTLLTEHLALLSNNQIQTLTAFQQATATKRDIQRVSDAFCQAVMNIHTNINRKLFRQHRKLNMNLPLLNVHLSYSIMRPSFAVPRASFSQTASD